MALIRLIHSQSQDGDLLIDDIQDGTPRRPFDDYYKQDVYITFNRKFFGANGVEVDETQPGFIDLIPTDDVLLSREQGTIGGLEAGGFLTIVDLADGALAAPTITTVEHDIVGGADATDDFRVVITGTNLLSIAPDVTTVALESDGPGSVTLTATDITGGGGTVSDTSIVIPAALHGFGTDNVTSAEVTADTKTVSTGTITTI